MVKVEYNFKIKELKDFETDTKIWSKSIAERLTLKIREILYNETKKETPVKTGYLKSGWKHAGLTQTGNAYRTKVYNDVKYAEFVEYGIRGRDGTRIQTQKDIENSIRKRKSYMVYKTKGIAEPSLFQTTTYKRFMLLKGTEKAQAYVDKIIGGGTK